VSGHGGNSGINHGFLGVSGLAMPVKRSTSLSGILLLPPTVLATLIFPCLSYFLSVFGWMPNLSQASLSVSNLSIIIQISVKKSYIKLSIQELMQTLSVR
ncbi:MAG: hypothetical protein KIH04_08370, partial [Candidatus Freyarchaeota archaeon]|nr:hypothetical protein [Candidatus Jordarchaeia archaeon]